VTFQEKRKLNFELELYPDSTPQKPPQNPAKKPAQLREMTFTFTSTTTTTTTTSTSTSCSTSEESGSLQSGDKEEGGEGKASANHIIWIKTSYLRYPGLQCPPRSSCLFGNSVQFEM